MNAITEIRRIEADLYRFMQTASEAPRLVHDYLGDIMDDGYVSQEEHETETGELRCDLENAKEDAKTYRKIIESFRDSIQDTKFLPYDPAAFIALVEELIGTINDADTGIHINASRILDDLSSIEATLEEEATAKTCLNSDTTDHCSPITDHSLPTNPEPKNTNHENQSNPVVTRPARCLPGFGKRAA